MKFTGSRSWLQQWTVLHIVTSITYAARLYNTLAMHLCIDASLSHDAQDLVSIQQQESNHEREKSSSFSEGESQDGVREELTCTPDQHEVSDVEITAERCQTYHA